MEQDEVLCAGPATKAPVKTALLTRSAGLGECTGRTESVRPMPRERDFMGRSDEWERNEETWAERVRSHDRRSWSERGHEIPHWDDGRTG